jgi:mono/diheme cytochrome c family protein
MSTLIFVLFWVLVGAVIVFIALSGGPRGARERMQSQSKGGRRVALFAFLAATLVLGIAVPTAVIGALRDRDEVAEAGIQLSESEQRGRILFGQRCRICHSLAAANATANVGPDLDALRAPKGLVLDAINNGRARGNGNMAAKIVEGRDAEDVANFIAKVAGKVEQ